MSEQQSRRQSNEIRAMAGIQRYMRRLSKDERDRVMAWAVDLYWMHLPQGMKIPPRQPQEPMERSA